MKTAVVYNFIYVDPKTGEPKLGPSKRTAERIAEYKLELVPGTGEVVDARFVDQTGRYQQMNPTRLP